MRIALISLDQRWHDKDANFAGCDSLVMEARVHQCELVVFPEMTLTGYSLDVDTITEEVVGSLTVARFGELARRAGVGIVFGACLRDASTGRPRNQLCLAQADGTSRPVYAKVHPFSFAGEDRVLEPGDCFGVVHLGALTLGASICYDLRFPEMYAAMAPHCNAAVVIASWPAARVAHWRILLVARAIENQFYMLGVNRIGSDGNGLRYEKSTLAVSPAGDVLAPIVRGAQMDIYDVDPALVDRYRRDFPTVRDKRRSLYEQFLTEQADT